MNREFVREYYDIRYEDPAKTASNGDGEYKYAREKYAKLEHVFMQKAGGMNSEIWQHYEDCIDARMEAEMILNRDFYLLGAKDYEKMKRTKGWSPMILAFLGGFLGTVFCGMGKKPAS